MIILGLNPKIDMGKEERDRWINFQQLRQTKNKIPWNNQSPTSYLCLTIKFVHLFFSLIYDFLLLLFAYKTSYDLPNFNLLLALIPGQFPVMEQRNKVKRQNYHQKNKHKGKNFVIKGWRWRWPRRRIIKIMMKMMMNEKFFFKKKKVPSTWIFSIPHQQDGSSLLRNHLFFFSPAPFFLCIGLFLFLLLYRILTLALLWPFAVYITSKGEPCTWTQGVRVRSLVAAKMTKLCWRVHFMGTSWSCGMLPCIHSVHKYSIWHTIRISKFSRPMKFLQKASSSFSMLLYCAEYIYIYIYIYIYF